VTSLGRPSKQCIHPGCRTTTIPGNARCQLHLAAQQAANHQRLHATQTSKERTAKYGAGWKQQRARIIKRDGGCAYCGTQGNGYPLEVHHITASTRPQDNEVVTLCRSHHRAIEAEKRRGQRGKVTARVELWMSGL